MTLNHLLFAFFPLQAGLSPQVVNIIFIVGLIAIFYFFMIRPQQQKQKKQKNFSENLKKGDTVVTVGGIHGKISAIEGDSVLLEVDRGVKIRLEKSYISAENTNLINQKASS
jgi:preprotein translocase subunit YajC